MSSAVQGGRALARFRVLGFPVHIDLSFFLIMAFLGYRPGVTASEMVIWLAITPLAVLVHELGHAVLARAAGAQPSIALAGFGGVTTYVPPGPLSRGRSVGISLAGPLVGLAIGAVLVAVWRSTSLDPFGWQATALWTGMFTTIGWSVLNLLPIQPLDGGQALRELLPGSPDVRFRRAAVISIVVAIIVAVLAVRSGLTFAPIFLAYFAVSNFLALRRPSASAAAPTDPDPATSVEATVASLLWQGRTAQARDVLMAAPPGTPVDLAVHGAVLAVTGEPEQGMALLDQEVARRPGDVNPLALLILVRALRHEWDPLLALLAAPAGAQAAPAVVQRAAQEAQAAGADQVAAKIAEYARR